MQFDCPHCHGRLEINDVLADQLIQCSHCQRQFKAPQNELDAIADISVARPSRSTLRRTSPQRPSSKAAPSPVAIGCGVVLVLLVVSCFATIGRHGDFDEESGAREFARESVRQNSKWPLDADFGWAQDASKARDGEWVVTGTVELKNGFGAMHTYRYVVVCKRIGRTWKLVDIGIDQGG